MSKQLSLWPIRHCNKCGYVGTDEVHDRPAGGGRCGYSAISLDEPFFDQPADLGCKVPPAGWWCSRPAGHKGPCAAWPVLGRKKAPPKAGQTPTTGISSGDA